MSTNYLEKFELWLVRSGRLDKSGMPCEGLSPRTARSRKVKIRRILVDMGYIKASGPRRFRVYDFQRGRLQSNIRELTVGQLTDWF